MNSWSPARLLSLPLALAVVAASLTACSGGGRSEKAFCNDLRAGEQQLNGSAASARPGIGSQLGTLAENIGRFTSLLHHLDAEAPPAIETDMHDVRTAWDSQKQEVEQVASNPLGGLAGALVSSLFTSAATRSVDSYAQSHCGAQLFGSSPTGQRTTHSPSGTVPSAALRAHNLAAGQVPSLTASENAAVKAVAADPTIISRVQSLAAKYAKQLATAAKMDPATTAALTANPNDQAAQVKALSEISGISAADVTTVLTLEAQHGPALAAAQAMEPATVAALLANPNDQQTQAQAVQQIMSKLGVSQQQAVADLQDLASIPVTQLLSIQTSGPKVAAAATQLKALAAVPAADLAYLSKYGPSLQDPKVQAALKFLRAEAPRLSRAH